MTDLEHFQSLQLADYTVSPLAFVYPTFALVARISVVFLLDLVCLADTTDILALLPVESGSLYTQTLFVGEVEQADEAE